MRRYLFALPFTLLAGWAMCADLKETLASGHKAYLEGRYADSAAAFRYLSTLGVGGADTDANLALLAREQGEKDAALPLWIKATLQEGDGFFWAQRGWSYLNEGRAKEARDSFLKAVDRSTTTATQAEANLGLGLAALARSAPKEGMDPLRSALVQGPFMMAAASHETALIAASVGDKQAALAYFRQALSVDPLHFESLRALARLQEKIGENRAAWRAYARIASLDPKDAEASAKVKKLAQFIPGDPETSMAVRRLTRPLLDPASVPVVPLAASSPTLRVALFTDGTGAPATITQAYFMVNGPFKLLNAAGETVKEDGRGFDQWEILYRPETDLVELRDASRNIQYTTKTPFKVVPLERQGSVLLKSAKFIQLAGFDRGDRELRGAVEGRPTPDGFKFVNELPLEDYLYGAVSSALPQNSPMRAYEAQAIVSRTLALWYKSQSPPNQERADICDSRKCQRYLGISEEMRDASKGVAATEGLVLTKDGRLARAMQHQHCGGFTEDGASTGDATLADLVSAGDGPGPAAPSTPLQLERFIHEFPARERYCEAQPLTAPSDARWVRLLEAGPVQERADRIKPVGTISRLRPARRTATGRMLALEVIGSRGSIMLEGADAIESLLSPGSLRSTLFTIQELPKGGPVRWVLWGAGTGHGLGFCRAGAMGQAALGRGYQDILSVYFPKYEIEGLDGLGPKKKEPGLTPKGKKLPLNPRFKPAPADKPAAPAKPAVPAKPAAPAKPADKPAR
jgi:stage II sporulation protein D